MKYINISPNLECLYPPTDQYDEGAGVAKTAIGHKFTG